MVHISTRNGDATDRRGGESNKEETEIEYARERKQAAS